MKDEMLKKNVMSEEQLDGVVGGYSEEIAGDKARFFQTGHLESENVSDEELVRVFGEFGVKVDLYHGCFLENMYSINGEPKTRKEVWEYIDNVIRPR